MGKNVTASLCVLVATMFSVSRVPYLFVLVQREENSGRLN